MLATCQLLCLDTLGETSEIRHGNSAGEMMVNDGNSPVNVGGETPQHFQSMEVYGKLRLPAMTRVGRFGIGTSLMTNERKHNGAGRIVPGS